MRLLPHAWNRRQPRIVDRKGVTSHEPGLFTRFLECHTVPVGGGDPVVAKPPKRPGSKLKKWSCGCTNVRVAVELDALCRRCGRPFALQETVTQGDTDIVATVV